MGLQEGAQPFAGPFVHAFKSLSVRQASRYQNRLLLVRIRIAFAQRCCGENYFFSRIAAFGVSPSTPTRQCPLPLPSMLP